MENLGRKAVSILIFWAAGLCAVLGLAVFSLVFLPLWAILSIALFVVSYFVWPPEPI